MVDMRSIWKEQIELCKNIAEDIIKNNASKKVLKHACGFAQIEGGIRFKGNKEYFKCEWIRINFGEAYVYVMLDKKKKPTGEMQWLNDEMGIDNCYTYEGSIKELDNMTIEEAYNNCAYIDCYEEFEGFETEEFLYVDYNKAKKLKDGIKKILKC